MIDSIDDYIEQQRALIMKAYDLRIDNYFVHEMECLLFHFEREARGAHWRKITAEWDFTELTGDDELMIEIEQHCREQGWDLVAGRPIYNDQKKKSPKRKKIRPFWHWFNFNRDRSVMDFTV